MGHSLNPAKSPFNSSFYFIACILDPNYQLFWMDDLVELDDAEDDPISVNATLKAKLKEMLCSTVEDLYPYNPPSVPNNTNEMEQTTSDAGLSSSPPTKLLLGDTCLESVLPPPEPSTPM